MEFRQDRLTAKNDEEVAKILLDKWPGWVVKIKPVGVIGGQNWYEASMIRHDEDEIDRQEDDTLSKGQII